MTSNLNWTLGRGETPWLLVGFAGERWAEELGSPCMHRWVGAMSSKVEDRKS